MPTWQSFSIPEMREAVKNKENLLKEIEGRMWEWISWADIYDGANLETQNMIVNCLIKRIEVFREY